MAPATISVDAHWMAIVRIGCKARSSEMQFKWKSHVNRAKLYGFSRNAMYFRKKDLSFSFHIFFIVAVVRKSIPNETSYVV